MASTLALQLLVGDAADLGDDPSGRDDVGRLVAPAPHLLRGQVGGVGLDQDQLVGEPRGGVSQVVGLRVGGVAANEQSQPRSAASSTRCGAEKQCRITGCAGARASSDREDLVDRLAPPSGSRAWITIGSSSSRAISIWAAKARRWSARARRLAVVVEPGLADRPHLLVLGEPRDLRRRRLVEAARLGRVAADGREDALVALRPGDRLGVGLAAEADVEHPPDPGLARRCDHLGLGPLAEEQVGVGVDHRAGWLDLREERRHPLDRLAAGPGAQLGQRA